MWRTVLLNATTALTLAFVPVGASASFELSPKVLELAEQRFGSDSRERLQRWKQLMELPPSLPEQRKLLLVNSFFNQIPYREDQDHWHEEDYWATPFELLTSNGGDCEDYSIAKYFTLLRMGVPDEKLRITYVKALKINQAHMVLAYYPTPDAEPLILDNLVNQILPASQREDLQPVYSFNGSGLWMSKQRGDGRRIGEARELSKWSMMNDRFLEQLNAKD